MIPILGRLFGAVSRPRRSRLTMSLAAGVEVGIECLENRDLLSNIAITDLVVTEISGGEARIYRSDGTRETRQLNITMSGVGTDRAQLSGPVAINDGFEIWTSDIYYYPVPPSVTPEWGEHQIGTVRANGYTFEHIAANAIGDLAGNVTRAVAEWYVKFQGFLEIDGTSSPITILALLTYTPLESGDNKLDVKAMFNSPEALHESGGINLILHRASVSSLFLRLGKFYFDPVFVYPKVTGRREVVAVISHGFKPPGDESTFMSPFLNLARTLENLPATGSTLDGEIDTYVTRWDSSTSFTYGFAALLFERIAIAKRDLAMSENPPDLESAADYQEYADALHQTALSTQPMSDTYLKSAALTVFLDLVGQGLLRRSDESDRTQVIELVGHSRGAGLNVELARLLWDEGYRNIEFIALDGYGSDWLDGGGILSKVDIEGVAALGFGGNKLNYIAADGLESDPEVEPVNWIVTDEVFAKVGETNDLRAPDRVGFDNVVIPGSFHTTITGIFGQRAPLLLQTYIGRHRNDGLAVPSLAAGPPLTGLRAEESAPLLPQSTKLPVATNRPQVDGFVDGSFDTLASLRDVMENLDLFPTDMPELDAFMQRLIDPQELIRMYWQTEGNVRISADSDDPAIEMREEAEPEPSGRNSTSIAQMVLLPDDAQSLEFDLTFTGASNSNYLSIRYDGEELEVFYLYEIAESGHISIPLTGVESHAGLFEFELWGWGPSSVVVTLDNIRIAATPNTAPVLAPSALELPDYVTGGVYEGALVSTFLTGISDIDPNARKGLAIVGVNPALGTAQYTLDGGKTWLNVGPVSDSLALLLAPHFDTRIRILTNGTIGSINDAFTFRAWDRSNGISALSGEYFDASVTGGVTPISTATATIGVTVIDSDPPTANPGGPYTVKVNRALPLDGSGSSDPEDAADQLIYQWDLDGDGIFGETGNSARRGAEVGMRPTFNAAAYTTDTSLMIALRVTDTSGLSNQASVSLNVVENLSPTANPGGPYTVAAEGSVQLNGSRSRDSETAVNHLIYDWDLDGDGIFGEAGANATRGPELDVINPTFVARGLAAGTSFDIALRVTDGGGLTHTAGTSIQIGDGIDDSDGEVTLQLAGTTPIWIKKQPPINVLSAITVAGDHFDGGVLWIGINAPGRKKTLDELTTPAISSIGTSTGFRFDSNFLELEIELGPNATAASIQEFLRGIKFATKGAGLSKATRDVYVNLTNVDDDYDVVTQKIQIQKKGPRSAIPRHARVR